MLLPPDLWVGGYDTLPVEVLVSGIDASPIILRELISTHCLMIYGSKARYSTRRSVGLCPQCLAYLPSCINFMLLPQDLWVGG